MCYSPRVINYPTKDLAFRQYAYRPLNGSELYYRFMPYACTSVAVPCGKCLECLRRKQNDLAVRASIEANKRGSMCFVTLTYDNAHLPLSISLRKIDVDTGEILGSESMRMLCCASDHSDVLSLSEIWFQDSVKSDLFRLRKSPHARVIVRDAFEFDGVLYQYVITPSVCRRDVSLWLKSARVAFEREFGYKLPEFSYVCCQEYGPNTCRPHAHLAFFGLPFKTAYWLCKRWNYGFFKCENVNCINKDGSFGFDICAQYIAKYCSKGEFEADSVTERLAQKPRLMISKGVGGDLTPSQVSYFRCEDVLKVNPWTMKKPDGTFLDEMELQYLYDNVQSRSHWNLSGNNYALPKRFIRQIWYSYSKNEKTFKASPLRKALSSLAFSDPLQDYFAALILRGIDLSPRAVSDLVAKQNLLPELNIKARKESARLRCAAFYSKSIF